MCIRDRGNIDLYNRLMEEALWGMDYVMKTRLGDGYQMCIRDSPYSKPECVLPR